MRVGGIGGHAVSEVKYKGIVLADVRSISLVFKRVIEQAKAAAPDQLARDLVTESKTRSKIVPLRLQQSLSVLVCYVQGNAIVCQKILHSYARASDAGGIRRQGSIIFAAGGNDKRRIAETIPRQRGGNEVCLPAVCFIDGTEVIPADAEVHRYLRGHLPIVLEVEGKILLLIVRFVEVRGGHALRAAGVVVAISICHPITRCKGSWRQQELGQAARRGSLIRNIRVRTAVLKIAMRGDRLESRELCILEFDAELEGVLAIRSCKAVRELDGSGCFVRGQILVAAQSLQVGDDDARQAAVIVYLWNARNPVFIRNPRLRGDRSSACRVQMSKAGAPLVYDVGAEYVRVGRHHLGRFRGLDALLERAAIGNAFKWSGNELRIIGVTETREDLIRVVRVEVCTGVERICVFK